MMINRKIKSRLGIVGVALLALATQSACTSTSKQADAKRVSMNRNINYPKMKKDNTTDNYFGTTVSDPYRWLEDDNSEETKQWVEAENKTTFAYLNNISFRDAIQKRLTEVWDYASESAPFKHHNYWLEFRNNGKQNQSVLYYRTSLQEDANILLDPNTFSKDGTVALSDYAISKDSKYLAYAISRSGSDWREIYVMDIATKQLLPDHIEWAKFTNISWYKNGFYYNRYPKPAEGNALKGENKNSQIFYHHLGDSQKDDVLIYEDKNNPNWGFSVHVSDNENYAYLYTTESSSGTRLALFTPNAKRINPQEIVDNFDNEWRVIGEYQNKLFVLTNWKAPTYQLLELDAQEPNLKSAKVLISESKETLENVKFTGTKLFCFYLKDAKSLVKVYDAEGKFEQDVKTDIGSVHGFSGDEEATSTFYTLTSFTTPSDVYKYDIPTGKSSLFKKSPIKFDGSQFETKQVFYTSKDGTKIPMFITYKKGLELNGENPTLIYAYGGFGISILPSFSVTRIPWLENGGILAVPNIRGGGEYGETWHKSGTKMQKQNVFDDFIAAAEYLQKKKYTCPAKTAIQGGSNGGLLIGACLTQRPDLYAVALPAVGVLDMLRYQYFTIGRYWATDYGTSEDSKEMFDYLYAYSPLHNVKEEQVYPATLITTADHDDRVVPAHSFKFAATLQEKASHENPLLIMISKDAGHGAGKPKSKTIEEYANIWAFTLFNMNEDFK
ncbi:MAG: prolyl oligopeptidase family serine peptidase [Mangrovibacterium sp.]